ncbi:MAG: hypothetical protein Q7S01_03130 [bacterium]|nr:hypothetical protein [bacterium]
MHNFENPSTWRSPVNSREVTYINNLTKLKKQLHDLEEEHVKNTVLQLENKGTERMNGLREKAETIHEKIIETICGIAANQNALMALPKDIRTKH